MLSNSRTQSPVDVSIVISTYNRCDRLPRALDALLAQRTSGVAWEAVIVDNNSTDRTRAVVQAYIDRGDARLCYVFEPRQGQSFGRNAGVARAEAPLIAFTDDDVCPSPDWVAGVKSAFAAYPNADFIGGKVLPRWQTEPPDWLTPDHWSPLALVDYGNDPIVFDARTPRPLVGANFAFRRSVFDRLGWFAADFQRVKDDGLGSADDHEMEMRVWRAGGHGVYIPGLVVLSDVEPARTTKAYHRKWYAGHGRFSALMRLEDCMSPEGCLVPELTHASKLFGVPSYVYGDLVVSLGRWTKAALHGDKSAAFYHENRSRHCSYYIRQRYSDYDATRKHSGLTELAQFAWTVGRKRLTARKVSG